MNPETWRVLLVEDDQVDRIAVRRALVAAPVPIKLDEVERASEVLERLRTPPGEAPYDCLLIDCYLPDSSGVELIQSLRKQGITTPILAVTGQDDEATEEALLAAGASDYMPKQDWRPDRLTRRIRHAIRIGRMETNYAAALAAAKSAVRDRDDLLSIVSHDLRSPLNAIRIAADELIDPNLDHGERKLMVGAVQRSLKRADKLICDLLDVSCIESGKLSLSCTAVSVKDLLERARSDHALAARDGGLELKVEVEPDLGMVLADRERILQVFGNLVGNAVRYAKDSGIVTLAAKASGDRIEFSVTDRGKGISADQVPHLFDRFFQANQQRRAGAGLGLAISKGIVEAHGGTITATSTLGKGTRFSFLLKRGK